MKASTASASGCTVGVGVCAAEGSLVCVEGGAGLVCDAVPGAPGEEICNDLDDDCNGQVDEGDVCGLPVEICGDGEDNDGDDAVDCGDSDCVRWAGSANAIEQPVDPRAFQARDDIGEFGWVDGGNDAFDSYGQLNLRVGDAQANLDMRLGEREGIVGGLQYTMRSELLGNVWRVVVDTPEGSRHVPVSVNMTGNLGSDGATRAERLDASVGGVPFQLLGTTDAGPNDPPVYTMMVPGDLTRLNDVEYDTERVGFVTVRMTDFRGSNKTADRARAVRHK